MRAITEIFGRILGQRGFMQHVAITGANNVDLIVTPATDLTESQAKIADVCSNDPIMQDLISKVHGQYEILKAIHNLDGEPWYGDLQAPTI